MGDGGCDDAGIETVEKPATGTLVLVGQRRKK